MRDCNYTNDNRSPHCKSFFNFFYLSFLYLFTEDNKIKHPLGIFARMDHDPDASNPCSKYPAPS